MTAPRRTSETGRAVLAFLVALPAGLFLFALVASAASSTAPVTYGPPALLALAALAFRLRRATPWMAAALTGLALGSWMAWSALPPGPTS
jgi:hypothetical protein